MNDEEKSIDLSGMLKNQKRVAQVPEYDTVQKSNSGTINFIMKHSGGLIRNEKQALYLVLIFFILTISLSLFLLFHKKTAPLSLPPGTILTQPEDEPIRLEKIK